MELIWGTPLASALIFSLCFLFLVTRITQTNSKKVSPPQAAGAWPLIGHLNLLSGPELPHIILSNLAEKYGPIFGIRLGIHPGLIISSWEIAKECFTTNDIAFSDRPQTAAGQLMTYNFSMFGFDKYGTYWRELRKISTLKLLSPHRVSMLRNVREIEIRALMKSVHNSWVLEKTPVHVEMKKCLANLTLSLMVRTVAGSVEEKMDFEESAKWRAATKDFFETMGMMIVSDALPFLKWWDYLKGNKKRFKKTGEEMDVMLQAWIEEHKKDDKSSAGEDFMAEMMAVGDSVAQEFPRYDADTITKATCQTMMIGGTDTMTVALTWALCLLLNNRHTLKRAQEELDTNIGKQRQVEESDIEKLVYIKAIIKETMRLYPPIALMLPRESSKDCVVSGYHVPAKTRMFVNLWKLHRDPNVWLDPLEFIPERFLGKHKEVDVRGRHFELLPFGAGRRICPGVSFALQFMGFALATLLHGFDIETPTDEPVDMTGSLGTTNVKATPLQVLLVPRLSPNIYA